MFLAAPFADELYSGAPTIGAPDIRASFGLGFAALGAIVLALPGLTTLLVETPLFVLADRVGRRRVMSASFLVFGLAGIAAAFATGPWTLGLAFAVAFPASGCALGLLEAAQMDSDPERREVWMTRWTLSGALGDLTAPAVLAIVGVLGFGWRGAFVAVSAFVLLLAPLSWLAGSEPDRGSAAGDDDERTARPGLRTLLKNGRLLAWTVGAQLCDLLDEILVILAALYLKETRGLSTGLVLLGLALLPAGSALGLVVTERLLGRFSARAVLLVSGPLCVAALAAFMLAPGAWAVAPLALVGAFGAPGWPVATAQTYRAAPESSTLVNAVSGLFSPLGVLLPVLVFGAAEAFGTTTALAILALQPAALVVLAAVMPRPAPIERRNPPSESAS